MIPNGLLGPCSRQDVEKTKVRFMAITVKMLLTSRLTSLSMELKLPYLRLVAAVGFRGKRFEIPSNTNPHLSLLGFRLTSQPHIFN
uniref:Uncharacterized protein n=1 Tax=Nelumbo nucifera TaxID=4432 RepID=A0A822Y9E5_NELNU|nr:TPA_asm: hypothetical protein HUJ06_030181 [Nelumbo nucifera]